jgi:ParB-like chromosome segregation protein Spo0J
MIRLRNENAGTDIDPREKKWKAEIEKMLAGEARDTSSDKAAFIKLIADIRNRTQLRPGVVTEDGGVIDGNRRLAALRRLNHENRERFRNFEAVILPRGTTAEDRWRIEAGLQLGANERWDYSPINELLKVRDGVRMYEEMIRTGRLKEDADPIQLVAKAIYGKTEAYIREMVRRLDLIDEFLVFTKRPRAYDKVGAARLSEDFVEAARIVQAAENSGQALRFMAKLKSVLFYVIDREQMDNWQLRKIYQALGGDPKRRGRKPGLANASALNEFLGEFPEPRMIQEALAADQPQQPLPKGTAATPSSTGTRSPRGAPPADQPQPTIDKAKLGAATEKFIRTMEAAADSNPPRKIAAGASVEITALHTGLSERKVREGMSVDDRAAVLELVERMQGLLADCFKHLKKL